MLRSRFVMIGGSLVWLLIIRFSSVIGGNGDPDRYWSLFSSRSSSITM